MAAMVTRRGDTVYAPPRNDAYVVLLIISLVAMILGCALLYLDYSSYPDQKAPQVSARQAAPAQQPAPQGGQVPPGGDQKGANPAPAPDGGQPKQQ
jgi:hypothetical protein